MDLRFVTIKSTASDVSGRVNGPFLVFAACGYVLIFPAAFLAFVRASPRELVVFLVLWLGSMLSNGSQVFSAAKRHESDETLSDVS